MNCRIVKVTDSNILYVEVNKTGRRAGQLRSTFCFDTYKRSVKNIWLSEERAQGASYTVKDDKFNQQILNLLLKQNFNYSEWREMSLSCTSYRDLVQDLKTRIRIKRLLKLHLDPQVNL